MLEQCNNINTIRFLVYDQQLCGSINSMIKRQVLEQEEQHLHKLYHNTKMIYSLIITNGLILINYQVIVLDSHLILTH